MCNEFQLYISFDEFYIRMHSEETVLSLFFSYLKLNILGNFQEIMEYKVLLNI